MARKFIIQDDTLRLGNVEMHKELQNEQSGNRIIGGGYWYIDNERTTLYLYGKSIDFGKVTIEDLKCIKELQLSTPSIEKLEWKWFDSDLITDVLENGEFV
ncbi:unnamed protein product [marine sediment metagenome]|uniref:Uncharacterized protein n=1 Tax=marine sediment metagenome TaxID=412755 RepID=X1GM55_9ZZZZ